MASTDLERHQVDRLTCEAYVKWVEAVSSCPTVDQVPRCEGGKRDSFGSKC